MFETFQTIINAGGYDLADFTQRIKTMYAMSELTEDLQREALYVHLRRLRVDPGRLPAGVA